MRILGIAGSLRKGSYNRTLLAAARGLLPAGVEFEEAAIGGLPLYNQDAEGAFPPEAAALKEQIRAAQGVVIATPEFNRSIPGALKNALDWTSRPEGEPLAWKDKPVWVVGASTGPRGANVAQYDLKRVMLYFGARLMPVPEFYVGEAASKFDAQGALTDQKTKELLQKGLEAFIEFAGR